MPEYRAYLLDRDGHILQDAEAAREQAKLLVGGHDVELWRGAEKIATFNHLDG
ncbi:hypothetical protein [Bradyrhizobium sp. JYMT SZCCT0428]|uniref:hypothetical protein n=1 Tax=Bradyrhizobium sp. JYMT SZCCT0428 TaxID=2807673 RepID=UPI001BAB1287|nr:hypothetical protein [Bradyrhizobium sp. JYMT SZCCT0428]MBR1152967.1 hypothetical protein [Bradyrhizobium sp. JYMT SZCCT0428]